MRTLSTVATMALAFLALTTHFSGPSAFSAIASVDLKAPPPGGQSATSTTCTPLASPLAIPDGNADGVNSSITISDTGSITDLNICLDVTHTWVGDLVVTLTHNGTATSSTIIDSPGYPADPAGCGGENILAVLDDEASAAAESQCSTTPPAIAGTLKPNNPLGIFDGESLTGTWTLNVSDVAAPDAGMLIGWSIAVTTSGPTPTPTPTPTLPSGGIAGDVDCSGSVNSVDALKALRYVAGLPVQQNEPCTEIGGGIGGFAAYGGEHFQGDVDCNGSVNAVDALKILRHVAGLPNNLPAGCPAIGTAPSPTGVPTPTPPGQTATPTPPSTPTPTPTSTPTPTQTPPGQTATPTPPSTPTPTPTQTPPGQTATPTPPSTPTPTPTSTPTPTPTPTPTIDIGAVCVSDATTVGDRVYSLYQAKGYPSTTYVGLSNEAYTVYYGLCVQSSVGYVGIYDFCYGVEAWPYFFNQTAGAQEWLDDCFARKFF